MPDYVWGIGAGDEMMIRDLGGWVEFWFHSDSQTWNNQQNYSYFANGGSHSGTFQLSTGGAWHRVASVFVSTTQDVSFTMVDEGLGWPTTTRSARIDRAREPDPPAPPRLTVRSSTVIELDWGGDGDNNGASIDAREYWGSDSTTPDVMHYFEANHQWTGLYPGVLYYFWAKAHNRVGWSGLSSRVSARTWRVPDPPDGVGFSSLRNTSVTASFTANGDGGNSIDAYQIGYGPSSSSPQTIVSSDRSTAITGLRPKTTYYFWARAHNDVGWGPWSPRTSIRTYDVPEPPSTPALSAASQTSMYVTFNANDDNGDSIDAYEIGYGTSATAPQTYISSDRSTTVKNLQPGTLYYFWARAKNAYGWSKLSGSRSARTIAGAWVNVNGVWRAAVPYVKVSGVWKPARAWSKIAGVWKETQ